MMQWALHDVDGWMGMVIVSAVLTASLCLCVWTGPVTMLIINKHCQARVKAMSNMT